VAGREAVPGTGTLPAPTPARWSRFEQVLRATAVGVMTLIVASAALGLLGVRTTTSTATGEGLVLTVEHAATARPGLAAPFAIEVASSDGAPLPSTLDLVLTSDYLAAYDQNGLDPQPATSSSDGDHSIWTFETTPGADRFRVELDARLEPSVQWRRDGTVALVVDERVVARVPIRTWALP
jgi:hypothetical protein